MNEIATEFPEKLLMFSPIGSRTYDMFLLGEQDSYSYPPRTALPLRKAGRFLGITLECRVSNAFFLKGPYIRFGVEGMSKDLPQSGRITMKVEGDVVLNDVALDIRAGEEKRYPVGCDRAGECQFFAFPYDAKDFSRKDAHGIFLPNGSLVEVQITGIREDVPMEIGLVMAEYKGKWSYRDERRIS